jgi:hypothetical protein
VMCVASSTEAAARRDRLGEYLESRRLDFARGGLRGRSPELVP